MQKTIAHGLLGMISLVAVFGILAIPDNSYAETKTAAGVSARTGCSGTCSFQELDVILPYDLEVLIINQEFLRKNNYEDSIGVQSTINQVQEALKIKEDTPAWIAIGNAAAQSAANAKKGVETLQNARNAIEQQKRLDGARAKCVAEGDACSQQTKNLIADLDRKIIRSNDVINGTEKPTSCEGFGDFFLNPIVCFGRVIAATVSAILISVAAWALAIAGVLFDWALMNAVILFKDVIFNPIKDGINIGWTAFRDIANIVIIGVFAFIAISIILGNKTFGDKRLVARVLVIAILINFSLLFTKMIIDASNFTAGQFYAATQDGGEKTLSQIIDAEKLSRTNRVPTASSGVSPFEGYSRKGIAGQFVNFLGVTSIAETYVGMREIAESKSNGWLMLVHAIFAMVLLLGAAIVLFYGAFLLISRAILLIFLMLTSAIAFASHLIPKMSDGQFGWSAWWKSLLGSAVLAPILMIFLYITLVIAGNLTGGAGTLASAPSSTVRITAAVGATSQLAAVDVTQTTGGSTAQAKGALGNLITKSAKDGDINALFNYLIVLGLLFGSFKMASSFSSKIGGFNYASMIPALGVGMAARAAGFVGRQTIGRAGTYIGEGFASRAKAAGPGLRGTMFDMAAQTFKKTGKRDFNMANTGVGKDIAGLAGLKGKWTGQTKGGGFEGDEKARKERFAERAGRMTHSDKELKDMTEKATEKAATLAAAEMGKIAENKNKVKEDSARLQNYVSVETEKKDAIEKDIKKINAEKPTNIEAAKARNAALADRQSMLSAQDQRIKAAARLMNTYDMKLADIKKQEVDLEEQKRQEIEKSLPKGSAERDEGGNLRIKSRRERLGDNAEEIAHKRFANLPWVLAGQKPGDDRLAKGMREYVGDKETDKSVKKALEALVEGRKDEAKHERRVERIQARTADQAHEDARHVAESGMKPPPPPPGPGTGHPGEHKA